MAGSQNNFWGQQDLNRYTNTTTQTSVHLTQIDFKQIRFSELNAEGDIVLNPLSFTIHYCKDILTLNNCQQKAHTHKFTFAISAACEGLSA